MRLAVFDLDGTLVDSHPAIVACFHQTFDVVQRPRVSDEAITELIGLPLRQMIELLFPGGGPELHQRAYEVYCQGYPACDRQLATTFEGIVELLQALRGAGYTTAIATSKSQIGLDRVLAETALGPLIEVGASNDTVVNKKPHPEMLRWVMDQVGARPEQTWMVGDTRFDVEMGRSASARDVIGVTWGAHDRDALRDAGAHQVVDEVQQLFERFGV